jgi:hypothetical protein
MRWPFVLGIAEDIQEQRDERKRELGKDVPCRDHKRRAWVCDDENRLETCDWKCR